MKEDVHVSVDTAGAIDKALEEFRDMLEEKGYTREDILDAAQMFLKNVENGNSRRQLD